MAVGNQTLSYFRTNEDKLKKIKNSYYNFTYSGVAKRTWEKPKALGVNEAGSLLVSSTKCYFQVNRLLFKTLHFT